MPRTKRADRQHTTKVFAAKRYLAAATFTVALSGAARAQGEPAPSAPTAAPPATERLDPKNWNHYNCALNVPGVSPARQEAICAVQLQGLERQRQGFLINPHSRRNAIPDIDVVIHGVKYVIWHERLLQGKFPGPASDSALDETFPPPPPPKSAR